MTESKFPPFFRVRQNFESRAIADLGGSIIAALDSADLKTKIKPGQSVAVTAGSRGIHRIAEIVGEVVRYVDAIGGKPFVVPAMGSHGGATDAGQAAMLASFGIDPASMNCPVVSSMETVHVGTTKDGVDVHFDKTCSQADHVLVVNRVKPHTRLAGRFESGISKMLMIGLGKHLGAQTYHQAFAEFGYSLDELVPQIVPMILDQMPFTAGLAVVEDAFDETAVVRAVRPEDLLDQEPKLLELARSMMPSLPFEEADLLIVDRIGKEISGTGMDTNVIGRKANDKFALPDEFPKIREIYVRSLTEKSAGNGCGIGIAEYCHEQFVRSMDRGITRINCVTSGHATAGAVPISFDSDRETLEAIVSQVGRTPIDELKWMRIRDTLHLSDVECSVGYLREAETEESLTIVEQPRPLAFDAAGDLATDI